MKHNPPPHDFNRRISFRERLSLSIAIPLAFAVISPLCFADDGGDPPQTVTITGQRPGGNGGGLGGGGGTGGGCGGACHTPSQQPPSELDGVDIASAKTDVRCAAISDPSLRSTTSFAGQDSRYLSAISVWSLTRSYLPLRREAIKNGFITVTYADEGTENWLITAPAFSDGGLMPVPGTLKKGDGIAKSKSCFG